MTKRKFVETVLTNLLVAIDRGIKSLEYKQIDELELVQINFENGCKFVNITADSLLATSKDVLNKIG